MPVEAIDIASNQFNSDNSMLVTPTVEWQDRLSSRYAVVGLPEARSLSVPRFNPGGQPPAQRRRLDKGSTALPNWDGLYKLEPESGECGR
jgi:hypothetical protein